MDTNVGAPAKPARWCRWPEIEEMFHGPADTEWERDRELVDDELRDPCQDDAASLESGTRS